MLEFTEIPYNWQVPGTFIEVKPALQNVGLITYPSRVLIVGQSLLGTNLGLTAITSPAQATALYGAGSMLEKMVAFEMAANPFLPLDVYAVADATGATKATGAFTVTGAWSQAGTVELDVGGVAVLVPVQATDTPTTFAATAIAAINAQLQTILTQAGNAQIGLSAVASAGGAGVITMTSRHGGVEQNNINLDVSLSPGSTLPPGMVITMTAMSGGATNPSIAAALNATATTWYTDIICPWNDSANLGLLGAQLAEDFLAMSKLDAVAYLAFNGTYGQISTWKTALNSQFRCNIVAQGMPTEPWAWAAAFGGVCAAARNADPARQMKTKVLPNVVAPRPASRFLQSQQQLLLAQGCSTFTVGTDGTVALQRVVTEYLTNVEGAADTTWHDVMSIWTASYIRFDWNTYLSLIYPNGKLAPDGSLAAEYDPSVATPKKVAGSWTARMTLYEQDGLVQNSAAMAKQATFAINANNKNRLDAYQPVQGIGNLMIFAGILGFS